MPAPNKNSWYGRLGTCVGSLHVVVMIDMNTWDGMYRPCASQDMESKCTTGSTEIAGSTADRNALASIKHMDNNVHVRLSLSSIFQN